MSSKLSHGELIQIFGIVVAIGRSDRYSIDLAYDTEFGEVELHLWKSLTAFDVDMADSISSRVTDFAGIIHTLKEWTSIIVKDRGNSP